MTKIFSQKFIGRNRAPRVHIQYQVSTNGAEKSIEIPFIMGVMANLSGKPKEELPPIEERKIEEIDNTNFNARMKAIKPRVAFQVDNMLTGEGKLPVELTFENMDDFSPAEVARRISGTDKLLEARTQLANLKSYLDGKADAEKLLQSIMEDDELLEKIAQKNTATESDNN